MERFKDWPWLNGLQSLVASACQTEFAGVTGGSAPPLFQFQSQSPSPSQFQFQPPISVPVHGLVLRMASSDFTAMFPATYNMNIEKISRT